MSHDCDCASCMETDSRWAPYREQQRALREDCPRGVHVAEVMRCTLGVPESAEYWCKHCKVKTNEKGKLMIEPKWTIADRYFYQAGPLPEDRYPSLAEMEKKAAEEGPPQSVVDKFVALHSSSVKCPCKKHRTYKAIRKPTSGCEECWRFYITRHP